jgi:hypothetical protein
MARKVAVIADSDGESDVDVAPSPTQSQSLPMANRGETVPDIDLGVNFSEFLSQSQRYDMNDSQHSAPPKKQPEAPEKSTGTTASLKRQIESEQRKLAEQKSSSSGRLSDIKKPPKSHSSDSPIVAKTKRRHSELGTTAQMDGGRDNKRKRQNTDSSSSSRLRSSQSDMFAEEARNHFEENIADLDSSRIFDHSSDQPNGSGPVTAQQLDIAGEVGQAQTEDDAYQADRQPAVDNQNARLLQHLEDSNGNHDAFKDYMQMSAGRVSTSRSLMGNYESINLDFSGSNPGLDVNANPFGDASQQSAEDQNGRTERERLEAIFRPPQAGTGDTVPFSNNQSSYTHNAFHAHQSGDDGAASLGEENYSRLGSGRSKSFVDPSVLIKTHLADTPEFLECKTSSSRKRRKTVDGIALEIASAGYEAESLETTVATYQAPTIRIETQGKKRGRKPKNQIAEPSDDFHAEQSKEQDDEINVIHAEQPSSELQLDDESVVGLPQEHYKPRPSRSRSTRNAEDEMPPPVRTPIKSVQTPMKQARTPDTADVVQPDEQEDTPLTKLKKEKKRKNKMKRAKTSAAALLKKSDKMLSDGEEDVVWLESKPATVKMKLPDPIVVKREESAKPEPTKEKSKMATADTIDVDEETQSADHALEEAAEISIDISEAQEQPQKPPPKKRGRKKKTAVEPPGLSENEDRLTAASNAAAEGQEVAVADDEESSRQLRPKASSSPQALKEKEVNTSYATTLHPAGDGTPAADASDPSKANNVPHAAAGSESPEKPQQQQQQQQQPPTPQPKSKESSERGPTKHSPINPAGGKVKYRVGLSRRATIPPLLKIVRK